jgi:hypothetical protein
MGVLAGRLEEMLAQTQASEVEGDGNRMATAPPQAKKKARKKTGLKWLRGLDLNQGPSGYEPDELPDCSTPR